MWLTEYRLSVDSKTMRSKVLWIIIAAVTIPRGERLDNDSPRDGNQECPTWFIHKNVSSGCKCSSPIGGSIYRNTSALQARYK